ncbi:MAG: DNA-directed RNA polymerase subunit L [Candidatus Diapherotrites archaeon]|nr:DNA-directed RNA polymerase subunit L [Candidatus Diapherotrites archaeon]
MEIDVLENKKDSLELLIKGETHTFPSILRSALLEDSKVEMAAYTLKHPLEDQVKFIVKTDGKTPAKALKDALQTLETELSEFEDAVKKAIK